MNDKQNAKWSALLEKLEDIPTLPMVANKVTELINDPNSSSADIAEVLKKDQVLTAKVLKLINSPYYGIPGGVTDVKRALAFLGFNTLAQLVLSVSIFSLFSEKEVSKFSLYKFWKHALATAVASEAIARKIEYPHPEECFTCGLLHDIGKIVLYQINNDEFMKIVEYAEERESTFVEAENALEIPPHGYLGEYIAQKWRLPMVIRMCIRYHHFDTSKMDSILENLKPAIHIVRLANQIIVKEKIGYSGDASTGFISEDMLTNLDLTDSDLAILTEKIHMEMENAAAFLTAAA